MTLEKYCETLDMWAAEEKQNASQAKESGDERMHSIFLMKASMMGDMLKMLGKVEMNHIRPGIMEKNIAFLTAESERLKGMDDYDAADRALIKAETIRRAWKLLKEG